MNYTISNDHLTVVISDKGAELQSIRTPDGKEYLWQGDPAYWTGHAPNIFPYVGRLTQGKYILNGKEYGFKNHGLVRYEVLDTENVHPDSITFRLDANYNTRPQFPYEFSYTITYTLVQNTIRQTVRVLNRSEERMYFAVGGHPGFNVPMEEGLSFEDYYLEFSEECHPYQVELSAAGMIRGGRLPFTPEANKQIPLTHSLFDNEAVVLLHADKTVSIKSDKGTRSVTVTYPDFRYIGFWHKPQTDAPYVCIEPWSSLPSRENIVENFAQQSDLLTLDEGQQYETVWKIRID